MVHVLAPKPVEMRLPVFFNVDSSVGRNAANTSAEDIMLVQFFLSLVGKKPEAGSLDLSPLAKIPVTGRINPETMSSIELFQRAAGASVDGRVSVAKSYRHGATAFTIVNLNFNVKRRFFQQWPNIEEMPGCPGILNLACRRALVGDLQ